MGDPVTVFMLVVAGLLVVGTVGEQVFKRTGVPAVIWLIVLGVLVRIAGIVPTHVITGIAPFFAALALVIILFDAGTDLTGGLSQGAGEVALAPDTRKRAQLLAFIGFAATVVLVALFSLAVAALDILPRWGWPHAFMLGSLVACGASEVALPSLLARRGFDEVTALLRRESAITKTLAVTGTVVCLDLLSPRVAAGGAGLAMIAGFGFALAFGSVAGMLWVVALQRLAGEGSTASRTGPGPGADAREARDYGFTLAAMVVLYVLSEAAGGSGPLSVLVFGAVLGNAGGLLGLLRRGAADEQASTGPAAGESVRAALGGHARTIEFVRTLMFMLVGLTLAPPWGPLVMGAALAFLVLIVRLAVARFTLSGCDHHERGAIGASAPRGLATVALATLPLAHAVPGAEEMLTLVFAAVTTSVLLFTIALPGLRPAGALRAAAPVAAVRAVPESPVVGAVAAHPGSTVVAPIAASTPGDADASGGMYAYSGPMVEPVAAPVLATPRMPVVAGPDETTPMMSIAVSPVETAPRMPVAVAPVAPMLDAHEPVAPLTALTPFARVTVVPAAPPGEPVAPVEVAPNLSPGTASASGLYPGGAPIFAPPPSPAAGLAASAPGLSSDTAAPLLAPLPTLPSVTVVPTADLSSGTAGPPAVSSGPDAPPPDLSSGTAEPAFTRPSWLPEQEPPLIEPPVEGAPGDKTGA